MQIFNGHIYTSGHTLSLCRTLKLLFTRLISAIQSISPNKIRLLILRYSKTRLHWRQAQSRFWEGRHHSPQARSTNRMIQNLSLFKLFDSDAARQTVKGTVKMIEVQRMKPEWVKEENSNNGDSFLRVSSLQIRPILVLILLDASACVLRRGTIFQDL